MSYATMPYGFWMAYMLIIISACAILIVSIPALILYYCVVMISKVLHKSLKIMISSMAFCGPIRHTNKTTVDDDPKSD
jgi:hypothetical protein